jgi:hypothetical protein
VSKQQVAFPRGHVEKIGAVGAVEHAVAYGRAIRLGPLLTAPRDIAQRPGPNRAGALEWEQPISATTKIHAPSLQANSSLLNATQTVSMFSNPRISPSFIFNGGFLARHSSPDRRPPAQITRRESGVCQCHPPERFLCLVRTPARPTRSPRCRNLDFRPKIARKEGRQVTSARATTTGTLAYKRLAELKLAPRSVSNYGNVFAANPASPRFQRINLIFRRRNQNRMKAHNGARKKAHQLLRGAASAAERCLRSNPDSRPSRSALDHRSLPSGRR